MISLCLFACGSNAPASSDSGAETDTEVSSEIGKETEKTDATDLTEENSETDDADTSDSPNENTELGYTFESPYFVIRFTEQEIEDNWTYIYYTVENRSEKEIYVKYRGWKQPAEPADPSRTTSMVIDLSAPDYDEPHFISLFGSPAEEANSEDRIGSWLFKYTFDEAGKIIDISDEGWKFDGETADSYGAEQNAPKEYEFVCDEPGVVINRYMHPYEEDGYVCITVDFTNNTNFAILDIYPGQSHSYTFRSLEPSTLDGLEVGDCVEIGIDGWTTENVDGKGGDQRVEVHAYIRRVK